MSVMDVVSGTGATIDATLALLRNTLLTAEVAVPWKVFEFKGTSYERLFETMPGILAEANGSPALVVCYSGSSYANLPRRTLKLSILVLVEAADTDAGGTAARKAMDRLLAVLDEYISGAIKWEAVADTSVDFGANITCYKVDFEARDH